MPSRVPRLLRNRWAAVIAALAVVAAVASLLALLPGFRQASRVQPAVNTIRPRAGLLIELPAGSNAHAFGIVVRPDPGAKAKLNALRRAGSPLAPLARSPLVYTSVRPVPAGTKLHMQLRRGIKTPVFEAYLDTTGRWVPEPTSYNVKTGIAIATIRHFSIHDFFTWSSDRIKALVAGAMKNMFDSASLSLNTPQCGLQNGVAMYVSNANRTVVSCNDATIIRRPQPGQPGIAKIGVSIVNARSYPISVVVPNDASVTTTDVGSVPAQIGAAITSFVDRQTGRKRVLLPKGQTARIVVTRSTTEFTKLHIETQLDGEAYLVGLLTTGIDEMATLGLEPTKVIHSLVKDLQAGAVLERVNTQLTDPDLSVESFKTLGDVGFDALKVVYEDTAAIGLSGLASLFFELTDGVVQSFWVLVDTVSGQSYHKFTFSTYGSVWTEPSAFARFAGRWIGHGRDLTINSSGQGEITYRAYQWCPGSPYYQSDMYDPSQPCDQMKGDYIISGGKEDFRIIGVSGDNVHAVTTYTTQPSEWGNGLAITFHPDSATTPTITVVASPGAASGAGAWSFCSLKAQFASVCGA